MIASIAPTRLSVASAGNHFSQNVSRSARVSGTRPQSQSNVASDTEYLWIEAENMRGLSTGSLGEPVLNPSWLNPPKAKAPGWGINGPGVSAEWSQGGESEWNSVAASPDENNALIFQDFEVPRAGDYKIWVRYADWAGKDEAFTVRITQQGRPAFNHEFGTGDVIDPHDEVSMYWRWAFTWDSASANLAKGVTRISVEISKAAGARRHVDCLLITNDLQYVPDGRRKPDFAAARYLREWSTLRQPLASLLAPDSTPTITPPWQRPKIAGKDFLMPWNIAREFWSLYERPRQERPLYPFNAEPLEEFVQRYKAPAKFRCLIRNL